MKICIACGMPMKTKTEHAMQNPEKDYCLHCARPDGSMQSFEEKRAGLTDFIINTQGFDQNAAFKLAEDMMRKLPAWQDCFV